MNEQEVEAVVRRLTARGIRVLEEDESTPEMVLSIIREQRRRHAGNERLQAIEHVGVRLAEDLAELGVTPADVVAVLVATSTRLGMLAANGASASALTEIMVIAADETDQRAKAGDAS